VKRQKTPLIDDDLIAVIAKMYQELRRKYGTWATIEFRIHPE
jgi:hypothetical protein